LDSLRAFNSAFKETISLSRALIIPCETKSFEMLLNMAQILAARTGKNRTHSRDAAISATFTLAEAFSKLQASNDVRRQLQITNNHDKAYSVVSWQVYR
jgi:hypothetical protein